ncbi:MAG: translation initiation factor IF-2 [Sulfurimonas sp. RIFOXYD12_FULL_33_39]|uniref:translation initiation factor IF-2 n=1 Tax=unclassified Sulfurimonas TaxID=2623549 RepID=UPI0008BD40CA|nr:MULTISPECIES: translation initiation factor IF-2 [unclassified Sulfurimonas]OHE07060.1 MAG: translation initiation factor IF-2 [Sulfurimonas sp. RIFCSPLOWO2_12_FULL_34_6]OHE10656.1 MAG: translation initiation factor IF-2 [Sulfurimonas sp. RIFOXYD12_FULL_33_39]OHE13169.1 MAG: translation initiation factor IF-2 [Sulfurimonas sp. RIFOXYD2_FULL_34_21]DAB27489.1 MAG TPA: translation initiation factor IF-2 [Sulfurimonas sp. UBA10385]
MTEKVRVHEIAKELGIASKDVVKKASDMGIDVKSANSSVSMQEAESLMNYIMSGEFAEAPKSEFKEPAKKTSDTPKEEKTPKDDIKPAVQEIKKINTQAQAEANVKVKIIQSTEIKESKIEDNIQKAKQNIDEKISEEEKATANVVENKKMQIKKSGLKIVKKKQPKLEERIVETEILSPKHAPAVSSYGKISAEVLEELAKKKKAKQSAGAKKQDQGIKIDIFGASLSEVSMDMDDQIVLLDLNSTERREIIADEPKKPKAPKPLGRNSNKKSAPKARNVSRDKRKKYIKDKPEDVVITHVEIPEDIRVYEFAEKLNRPISDVIKVLFSLGLMMTKNDFLGNDEIEILSEEFGVEVTIVDPKNEFNYEEDMAHEIDDNATERPPVITIMGHVDHGKTSLLDAIRKAKVTASEAGGITQHIGAYTIEQHGKAITFIDTPGHAAFSSMRQRGTDVTDIIVIVVAADDGVKPQTDEVIKLAKESKVPVIVALNKMDKESANPDMVKGQMAERGLNPIDWGGDIEFVPVSAKTGMGIDDLLENILLTAEVMELKANENAMAKAAVVESSLEKGRGPVATVIVQNGTLKVGDYVVCGSAYGRVKALIDENKQQIKSIKPSHTAVVVGLNEVPSSGEIMMAMNSDKEAREYAQKRHEYDRHKELSHSTKSTLEDMTSMIAEGRLKSLKVVLKTDVHGSLEAIRSSLSELRNDEVKINVISSGVGGITENDVELVGNSENCVLLGFNVRPTGSVKALAKQRNVDIRTYSIIYQLLDDMTGMLTGMMSPKFTEENTGQAEVRNTFKAPKGMVAGCVVVDGKLVRGGLVRVIRNGVVVHEGELTSLKRFKDDVEEIGNGYECGVMIKGYDDVIVGDVIETFKKIEQKVSL